MQDNSFEQSLVLAAQSGNQQAFERLYGLYYSKVYALALSTLKNSADAEDVLQQTFISAWQNLKTLADASAFNTWIQRITLNRCYTLLRSRHIMVSIEADEDDEDAQKVELESDFMLPEVYAEKSDLSSRLGAIINSLSAVQRQTVTLFYYDGMTIEEIAKVMDCSESTVKSRLFLARKALKTEIEEQERKSGQKFYGVAGLPLIAFAQLFKAQVTAHMIPGSSAATLISGIMGKTAATAATVSAAGGAVNTAATAAGSAAAKTAGAAGVAAAKTAGAVTAKAVGDTAAKVAAKGIAVKVIAAIAATGITIGGVVGGAKIIENIRENKATETAAAATYKFAEEFGDDEAYASLKAYDENGNKVWEYDTDRYELAQYTYFTDLGVNGEGYYIVAPGNVICVDKNTGKERWKEDMGAAISDACFDGEGSIYVTFIEYPDIVKLNSSGKTVWETVFYPNADNSYNVLDGSYVTYIYETDILKIDFMANARYQTVYLDPKTGQDVTPPSDEDLKELLGKIVSYFTYNSGAGSWETTLSLNKDGTFTGSYQNYDYSFDEDDHGYTCIRCAEVHGKFTDVKKIDDYIYSAKLTGLTYDTPTGTEKLVTEDDGSVWKYVYEEAYGIADGKTYYFYLNGAAIYDLDEDFLDLANYYSLFYDSDDLRVDVIYNEEESCVFIDSDYYE